MEAGERRSANRLTKKGADQAGGRKTSKNRRRLGDNRRFGLPESDPALKSAERNIVPKRRAGNGVEVHLNVDALRHRVVTGKGNAAATSISGERGL